MVDHTNTPKAPTDDSISLRQYVDIVSKGLRDQIDGLATQIALSLDAHNKAHEREHQMTETAVVKAEEAMTMRLEQMNEFRSQITDERGSYLTKAEFARFEEGYMSRHQELVRLVNEQRNMWSRLQGQMVLITAAPVVLSMVATAIAIWVALG